MRQCLECGTSFKSDKVEFCFACGAPLPEPVEEAGGNNLAEALDPLELDVPEPEAIQEQDEPTEVLDYTETSQPIARPAGLDGARGPVTETPTGEVVLTEDLEIPVPMMQAPPPTAPIPLPSSEPTRSKFPSNVQVGTHLSEADTVPVEPVVLSSAEVEEVDTADADLPFFDGENTEELPNQRGAMVPDLSEPEILGVLDEPTAPMVRPVNSRLDHSFDDHEPHSDIEGSFFDDEPTYSSEETVPVSKVSEGLDYQYEQGRGYGMAMLGAAVVVLGIGGIVFLFSGSDEESASREAVVQKDGTERAARDVVSGKSDPEVSATSNNAASAKQVNKGSLDGRAVKPTQTDVSLSSEQAGDAGDETLPVGEPLVEPTLDMSPELVGDLPDETIRIESGVASEPQAVETWNPALDSRGPAMNAGTGSDDREEPVNQANASNTDSEPTAANLWGVEDSGSGVLSIRTVPEGAQVRVDGSQVGRSPVEIERPFSTVSIQASMDGYKAKYLSYDFKDEGQPVYINLEKIVQEGQVMVYGALGAKLFVDDTAMGNLPMTLNLKEGSYQFRAVTDSGAECVVSSEITFTGSQIPRVNLGC